jgi:glycyl-tRNA synthetase
VEFEQMEQQFFVRPEEADRWFDEWRKRRLAWYTEKLKLKKSSLRTKEYKKDELAHYARAAEDIEFHFPFGWNEIEGVHHRGDWDLSRHQEFAKRDLSYFDEETKEKFLPYIIETSAGADRVVLAMLCDAYTEETVKDETRVVLKLHPYFSPYRAAVFPLVKTDKKLTRLAKVLFNELNLSHSVSYDEQGSIGRRYRRHDEVGTAWAITVDGQSLEDGTVTVRDRDTLEQVRIHKEEVNDWINDKIKNILSLRS